MSVGTVKEDNDKKGDVCKVVDIIINPNIQEKIFKDINLKNFFIELVTTYIN